MLENKILISSGAGIITIMDKYIEQFNSLLLEYYNIGRSEELQMLLDYFDGREPESQLAKDIDRKVFEARNNKQWRREYMSYQMELDKQFRNGREEGREEGMDNISKLLKLLVSEKKYDEIEKISEDKEYQKELLKKYKIIE